MAGCNVDVVIVVAAAAAAVEVGLLHSHACVRVCVRRAALVAQHASELVCVCACMQACAHV